MQNMGEEKVYLQVLKDSLREKQNIMNSLLEATTEQSTLLKSDSSREIICDAIMEKVSEKEELLKKLEYNNQGFEKIYQRLRPILIEEKETYHADIVILQEMIKKITDDSLKLEALERKNKEALDMFLKKERERLRDFRMVRQNSVQYYQHMANKHQIGQTYFLDHKQ